ELGVPVEDGWLHISNHPWTPATITGTSAARAAHAFIALTPSNIRDGLPQANALLRNRAHDAAAAAGISLGPWREAYHVDDAGALGLQRAALGYATPPAPGADSFAPVHPRANHADTFHGGAPLPNVIPDLRLSLGFEDDGLRSRVEFLPR
ncbi:MAG: hypothetical protein FWF96_02745, partial [Kiritimatiellaeota bacterium]|nr:hypothetical protein [Kiritimatiellota bacterium]